MTGPTAELNQCGFCGNFCRACPLYLGSTEAPESLEALAKRVGKPIADFTCHGCRSDVLSASCRACHIRTCAETRSVTFCVDCSEYPCADLRALAAKSVINPVQLMEDGEAIKSKGWSAWHAAKTADFACSACGTINSAYEIKCRKCANDPSNAFVGRHRDAVVRFLAGRK